MIDSNEIFEKYIDKFLERTYRIKQLIGAHSIIAQNNAAIKFENFWRWAQGVIIPRLVTLELFNILDQRRNNITLKKLIPFINNQDIQNEFTKKQDEWFNQINSFQDIRDKEIAHFDDFDITGRQINYEPILHIIEELENFLLSISSKTRSKIKNFAAFDLCLTDLNLILKNLSFESA